MARGLVKAKGGAEIGGGQDGDDRKRRGVFPDRIQIMDTSRLFDLEHESGAVRHGEPTP